MNNIDHEIKKFTKGDIASIVFIGAAVLNILGSDKEKEYLVTNDINDKKSAYDIYIIVLLILIILYLYFIKSNYQEYQKDNSNDNLIRLYGSIFFLGGGLCFLYYRLNNKNKLFGSVEI